MKILIVEDNKRKQKEIIHLLDQEYNHRLEIDVIEELLQAKRKIDHNKYDLIILDFAIKYDEYIAKIDYGIEFYDYLMNNEYDKGSIIGYSSGIDITKHERKDILKNIKFIKYDIKDADWEKELLEFIKSMIQSKKILIEEISYDLAVVTALKDEFEYMKKASDTEWYINRNHKNDLFNFWTTRIYSSDKLKSITVVACTANKMGMSDAASLSTKLILSFMPKYLCMTGICAGLKGKTEKGNIIIAERFFNYQAVTINKEKDQPTFYDEICNDDLLVKIEQTLEEQDYLDEIRHDWEKYESKQGSAPSQDTFEVIVRKQFGTGSAVVKKEEIMTTIQKEWVKDIIALDMEAYSVMVAAKYAPKDRKTIPFVIKAVQDFADVEKDKTYRAFSCYASARLLFKFCNDRLVDDIIGEG
jgi:nucleoside phosphorylase/CheY-like chemotaxis protein